MIRRGGWNRSRGACVTEDTGTADVQSVRRALDESAMRIVRLRNFINARAVTRNLGRKHLPDMAWNDHLGEGYRALNRLAASVAGQPPGETDET